MDLPRYLSGTRCARCAGFGQLRKTVCPCVHRRVARVCIDQLQQFSVASNAFVYSRQAEYAADLQLIARRSLDETEFRIFTWFLLEDRDFRWCCGKLRTDRGNFFHAVYRVERKLGEAILSTVPHTIFPPQRYLSGAVVRTYSAPAARKRAGPERWLDSEP